jgi:DNA-directed RNA polymerase subunit RPC12/RpoP
MNPQIETYKVELPGKILYPDDAAFYVKKITPFEQKRFFSNMSTADTLLEKNQVVIDLLKRLVVCENYKFDDIYAFDYQFLLYQIRAVTYKLFPIKFYHECEECSHKISQELDISQLKVETLESDQIHKTIELDNFGHVPFRYRKVKDTQSIFNWLKKNNLNEDDWMMQFLTLDLLALDHWKSIEETWPLVINGDITVQDTIKIEQIISDFSWGVKEEITFKCPNCGKEVVVPYTLDATDFFSSNNS